MLFIISVCDALATDDGSATSFLIVVLLLRPEWPAELVVAKVRWWFDWDLRCLIAVMLL